MEPASEYPLLQLCVISPPYEELRPVSLHSLARVVNEHLGTLICVDVRDSALPWVVFRACVGELRSLLPAAPLILSLSFPLDSAAVALACRAGVLRIRAVLAQPDAIYETLRPRMTDPVDLADDVWAWLRLRLAGRLSPESTESAHTLLGAAMGSGHTRPKARTGPCLRHARRCFQKDGIPPPGTWLRVGCAVRTAVTVQAQCGSSLLEIACSRGYSDQASLSRQFQRLFGLRPSAIRGTLGWEWILERWVRRAVLVQGQERTSI